MNELERLIRTYLKRGRMMQLATVSGDQPWACTVEYASDEDLSIYWISTPGRRHSREIAAHGKVAVAIPIQFGKGEQVIGMQIEGDARRVEGGVELEQAARLYDDIYKHDDTFYEDFVADRRQHKFYVIKPRLFVLFDEQTYATNARKEWRLGEPA